MPCPKKPKINWLDKARFISHYAIDGCSTTLRVYVQTFVKADTNLVFGLVNTSPEDFVRFLLRPKGARTQRHGIRGLSRGEAVADEELFPDTAKLAADTIHTVTGWHVPTWGELGDAFYEVVKPLERGLFYGILANVTEDFAFDWYSGILLSPDSKCTLGRFAFLGGDGPSTRHPYIDRYPGIPLIPPTGCHTDLDGLHLNTGTWCVILSGQLSTDHNTTEPMTALIRLALNPLSPTNCGGTVVLDIVPGGPTVSKKIVIKVQGPETIWAQVAVSCPDAGSFTGDLTILLEGFRI